MKKLALFASGTGSNVKNIISYFKNTSEIFIDCVISNKMDAGALNHARKADISSFVYSKTDLESGVVTEKLIERGVTHIVLAGFLLKIPSNLINRYPKQIINVHPSLLPKYGGAGMYGMNVHRAVVAAGEVKSGISIHLVNEIYDDGEILAQFEVEIDMYDSPEKVAAKVIENYLNK